MDVDFLPSHLIILGGSYVGLEFAQMYRRFGSEVTVIELAPRLIPREDADVSQAVAAFLREEGIDVRVDTKVVGVEKDRNSITVKVESVGKISQVVGTHVLVAIGRRPNTDDLGVDKAGIATDGRGYIQVDDQLRTNVPGIWAMGDCNGRGAFTHTSWNDFEIVAANLLDNDQRRVSDRITAYALFTDPPLGRAGMTEAEVRKTGRPALISTKAMEDVSRAYEKGETKGFMKILVDQDSKQILGASFLGLAGDEVDPLHPRSHVCEGTLHGDATRDAHPSHRVGVHSDHDGRPRAVAMIEKALGLTVGRVDGRKVALLRGFLSQNGLSGNTPRQAIRARVLV